MHYQLTYIIPADAAGLSALEKIIADINKKIIDAGGIIKKPLATVEDQIMADSGKNTEEIEKIKESQNVRVFKHRLSYPIKHVSYGFYVTVVYELADKNQSAAAKKINAELKLIKEIIRFINTKYNFEVFAQQARQKEKIGLTTSPEKAEVKKQQPAKKMTLDKKEQENENILLDEKSKKDKKTEIEELDEKLEQILNA